MRLSSESYACRAIKDKLQKEKRCEDEKEFEFKKTHARNQQKVRWQKVFPCWLIHRPKNFSFWEKIMFTLHSPSFS